MVLVRYGPFSLIVEAVDHEINTYAFRSLKFLLATVSIMLLRALVFKTDHGKVIVLFRVPDEIVY